MHPDSCSENRDSSLTILSVAHSGLTAVSSTSSQGAADKILEKLTAGTLPALHDAGGLTFVGSGAGQICDGCETPIVPQDMEYAVEARDRHTFRFHVRCAVLWQMYGRQRML